MNYESLQDESKTRTRKFNKLPGDEDRWALNNITENLEQK